MRGQRSLSRSRLRKPSSISTPFTAPPERTTATSRATSRMLGRCCGFVYHAFGQYLVDAPQCLLVQDDARRRGIVLDLLRPRGADDRRCDVRLVQHPRERELGQRYPELVRDRAEPLHPFEQRVVVAAHEHPHLFGRLAAVRRRLLTGLVLAREDALCEWRPHDLGDAVLRAELEELPLGPPQH